MGCLGEVLLFDRFGLTVRGFGGKRACTSREESDIWEGVRFIKASQLGEVASDLGGDARGLEITSGGEECLE